MLADAGFIGNMPHELSAVLVAAGITVVAAPSRGVDAWLAANKVRSVLIRPDAYVFATPNSYDDLSTALSSSRSCFGYCGLNQHNDRGNSNDRCRISRIVQRKRCRLWHWADDLASAAARARTPRSK